MAQTFDAANAPFDRLSPHEVSAVEAALDIGYFRPGETLIARDDAPEWLFVVIKGCVEERDGDEAIGLRGPGDSFDSRALVQGGGPHAFVAREETLCNLVPRDLIVRLIHHNPRFAAFFYREISRKLEAATRDEEAARFSPLLGARVRDAPFHSAVFVAWHCLQLPTLTPMKVPALKDANCAALVKPAAFLSETLTMYAPTTSGVNLAVNVPVIVALEPAGLVSDQVAAPVFFGSSGET